MNQMAVVLGASTGTGAAIAARLRDIYPVVVGFHRGFHPKEADMMAREWGVQMAALDVGTNSSCVRAGVSMLEKYLHADDEPRQIGVLVHALSGAAVGPVLDTTTQQIETTFSRMAHSFLWWAQELRASKLLAPGAKLIALSNPVADHYLSNSGVIGAAKAALEAYVRMLAVELGAEGCTVIGVRFGAVVTPALEKVVPKAREQLSALHKRISPYGELQTPSEIGWFVKMLVNQYETRGLNGAILNYTNGAHLTLMDYAFNSRAS